MLSRLLELRRARGVAFGALALALGAANAPVLAQQAPGLRGADETLAQNVPQNSPPANQNVAPSAADAAPDALAPVVSPPVLPDAKPKPKPAKTAGKPPDKTLPALKPYVGAQRLGLRGGPTDNDATPPAASVAALPTLARRKPTPDDKPFDPVGVRIGDLKLTPYVEEDGGWAANPNSIPGPHSGSGFETTEAGVALQSDWPRSDLHGLLKGSYTDYFADPNANTPTANGVLDGRYDASRDLSFDAEGRFNIAEQTLASLGLGGGAGPTEHPLVSTYGATIGGAQKFGDLTLALHGTWDRTDYQSITGVDLASDDFNDWGLRGRASYRLSEAVSPFVELDADARRYDASIDYTGYDRNSDGWQGLVGATLAFTKLLTGEASVGYGARAYADPRLPNFGAPVFDASLIWSMTPLTTITAKAQTTLGDAVVAGASGAVTRTYSLDIAHELTRAVTLGATASWTGDDYVGVTQRDSNTNLALRAEYHISRDLVLKASATRQAYESSLPNSNYVADVFMLGLRLQR
ncbi:MAG: hypothetical protein E7774_14745 [Bradyrhizobium sp.]|nr:MAG: hypothetical protein E7774_14745 [Bradyrhizobium sp.]